MSQDEITSNRPIPSARGHLKEITEEVKAAEISIDTLEIDIFNDCFESNLDAIPKDCNELLENEPSDNIQRNFLLKY